MVIKVLLIDDDPIVHMMTGMLLRNMGFEVTAAHSGREGIACAQHHVPHLILLDMVMPDQDGGKTCMELRAGGYMGKILMISAHFDLTVAYAVDQYGADGFISKPISYEALTLQLEQLGFVQSA